MPEGIADLIASSTQKDSIMTTISTPTPIRIALANDQSRDPMAQCVTAMEGLFPRVRFALAHIGMLPKARQAELADFTARLAAFAGHTASPDDELLNSMDSIMDALGREDVHPSEATIIEELDQAYNSLRWVLDRLQAEWIIRQLKGLSRDL